ncbi:MAG: type II secretion system protein [Candidatus Magasanikbacteria bacterium]
MKIDRKNRFGFTIVEVLVVIGIIGILTVIIFPAISEIRAKNRDAEKVSDIATIQLALSLYYSQNGTYPNALDDSTFFPKFLTADSLESPNEDEYQYVPLTLSTVTQDPKCTYYHLGVELELPSAQIDTTDNFTSVDGDEDNKVDDGYLYCGDYEGTGINGIYDPDNNRFMYDVRP